MKNAVLGTTTTTTDIIQSDTLKHILTPESEAVEPTDYHLQRIEAVEPLHHVHDPRRNSSSSSSDRTLVPEPSEASKRDSPAEEVEEGQNFKILHKNLYIDLEKVPCSIDSISILKNVWRILQMILIS